MESARREEATGFSLSSKRREFAERERFYVRQDEPDCLRSHYRRQLLGICLQASSADAWDWQMWIVIDEDGPGPPA
jgi:hypothetical protein